MALLPRFTCLFFFSRYCSLSWGSWINSLVTYPPKPPLLADVISPVSTSIATSSPLCFCCWLGLFGDAQGTETCYLLQTMFWGEANFQSLQGSPFLQNYTPTTKPVSKAKGDAETLGYHFGSHEHHRGKITVGFLSPYQSLLLINWNTVEKPTWRPLGSCETWKKMTKFLRRLNKLWVGKR